MSRYPALLACLLLLVTGTAFGQIGDETVVLPLAVNFDLAGDEDTLVSAVQVTNLTEQDAVLTYWYVARAQNGGNPEKTNRRIRAGSTFSLNPTAPAGGIGYLAMETGGQLQYQAAAAVVPRAIGRVEVSGAVGDDTDIVPVLTDVDYTPGGGEILLDGSFGMTDIFVLNRSGSRSRCTAVVTDTEQNVVGEGLRLTLRRYAMSRFTRAARAVADHTDGTAFVRVTCPRDFFAWAIDFNPETGNLQNIGPDVAPPSSAQPPPSPSCSNAPAGTYCAVMNGLVHEVKRSPDTWSKFVRWQIPGPPGGTYRRFIVEYDVTNFGWNATTSDLHLFSWIVKNSRNVDMIAYITARGPGRNQMLYRHGIGTNNAAKARILRNFTMPIGVPLHVYHEWNGRSRIARLRVTRGSSTLLEITSQTNVSAIRWSDGDHLLTALGNTGELVGEPPQISPEGRGWTWHNMIVRAD